MKYYAIIRQLWHNYHFAKLSLQTFFLKIAHFSSLCKVLCNIFVESLKIGIQIWKNLYFDFPKIRQLPP